MGSVRNSVLHVCECCFFKKVAKMYYLPIMFYIHGISMFTRANCVLHIPRLQVIASLLEKLVLPRTSVLKLRLWSLKMGQQKAHTNHYHVSKLVKLALCTPKKMFFRMLSSLPTGMLSH